jgi:hypothetical protein
MAVARKSRSLDELALAIVVSSGSRKYLHLHLFWDVAILPRL